MIKKNTQLRPLIIIAILANLLTLALYIYVAGQPGGSGLALLFIVLWMPAVWLISIFATIVIAIIKRKSLFKKPLVRWTFLTGLKTLVQAMPFRARL